LDVNVTPKSGLLESTIDTNLATPTSNYLTFLEQASGPKRKYKSTTKIEISNFKKGSTCFCNCKMVIWQRALKILAWKTALKFKSL
jgi:hypothetical protein